jgi:hypothetical protein
MPVDITPSSLYLPLFCITLFLARMSPIAIQHHTTSRILSSAPLLHRAALYMNRHTPVPQVQALLYSREFIRHLKGICGYFETEHGHLPPNYVLLTINDRLQIFFFCNATTCPLRTSWSPLPVVAEV